MKRGWFLVTGQRLRRENWPELGLLLAAFATLVLGMASTVTGLEVGLLWFPVFLGVMLGWGLAASPLSSRLATIISILVALPIIFIRVGRLMATLLALVVSFIQSLGEIVFLRGTPQTTPLNDQWGELIQATDTLIDRLYDWISALLNREPIFDPVATAMIWLFILWAVAVWAGWTLRRRNQPMLALLPSLLLLAVLLAVSGSSSWYLALMLALLLVLKATLEHRRREQKWTASEIKFSHRSGRNNGWTVVGLAMALVLISLAAPSPSIYRLVDSARYLIQPQREQVLARSLGLEAATSPAADPFSDERLGGLPARHLIGSGPELSQQPVMAITFESSTVLAKRLRYWRGVTYDRYTGRGWESSGTTSITYKEGVTAGRIRENQIPLRQEVSRLDDFDLGGLLFTAGTVMTVDQPFQIAWRARFLGTDTYTDFFAAAATDGEATEYRADSLVPLFNEAELRAAGGDYPDRITDKYLALPDSVTDRVRALARDITATGPSPYDRAEAVERYLRRFPYTLDLPAPPADREISDYFLFDLQRGYCDYYATSMVILARAAGLPARLATGYIGGTYDEVNNRYTVTADLAHSWPEIYFPNHGWIPFEPTAGRAEIDRPALDQPQSEQEPELELEPIMAMRHRSRWVLALRIVAALILASTVAVLGWWSLGIMRLWFLTPNQAIIRIFDQMRRNSRRLDMRPEPGATPHEFAGLLYSRLAGISRGRRGSKSLSSTRQQIDWLADLYAYCLFSPHEPGRNERAKAIRTWSRLRLRLVWAALVIRRDKVTGHFIIKR